MISVPPLPHSRSTSVRWRVAPSSPSPGELDLATAPELRQALGLLSEQGKNHVTLDLTHLDFVDSTGLSVFVMAFNRAHAAGGSMVIRNPSLPVMRIFEITGLTSVFTIAIDGEPVSSAGA